VTLFFETAAIASATCMRIARARKHVVRFMNRHSAAFKLRRQHGPDSIAKALAAGDKKAERITKMQ
jgi:hypothetical protein